MHSKPTKSHSLEVSLTHKIPITLLNLHKMCISSMECHSYGTQLLIHAFSVSNFMDSIILVENLILKV